MDKLIRLKDGRRAHRECVERFNSTMSCGLEHGQCSDPRCCLSKHPSKAAQEYFNAHEERQKGAVPIRDSVLCRSREEAAQGITVRYDVPDLDVSGIRHLSGDRDDGGWAVRPYLVGEP